VVELASGSSDLTLQMLGTYTFTDDTVTYINQDLVLAVDDNLDEGVECYKVQLKAAGGDTTAADEIGDIGSAEICILDVVKTGK